MRLDPAACRERFALARVARLATMSPDGPHVVPIVFAVAGDTVLTIIDDKPKRSRTLRRLANLAVDNRAAVMVDHYSDDWDALWWVRADATAEVTHDPAAIAAALRLLASRYAQYVRQAPPGPLIRLEVHRWSGWAATPAHGSSHVDR